MQLKMLNPSTSVCRVKKHFLNLLEKLDTGRSVLSQL